MHQHKVASLFETTTAGEVRQPADRSASSPAFRVGAKALVRSGDQVLLVRERREDGSTFWTLPGGGVEPGEALRDCLQREFLEELGCRVGVGQRIATCLYYHRTLPNTVTLYSVFRTTPAGNPEPNPEEGIVEYAWRSPWDPPPTTLDPITRVLADPATHR